MVEEGRDKQSKSETTREIFEDLKEWSGKVFQKVVEEADTLSTKGKLKFDLTSLKSRRGSEYKKLGIAVYPLLEEGKIEVPEAEPTVEQIRELAEKIAALELQLREAGRKPEAEAAAVEKKEEEVPEE